MPRSLVALAAVALIVAACGSSVSTPSPAGLATPSVAPSQGTGESASQAPSHKPKPSPTQAPVTAPPPTPVASSVDAALCAPGGVKLDVKGETTKSAVVLIVDVTNASGAPCALATAPANIGLRAGGGSLPTTYEARQDPWPGDTPDAVAPPVVLRPNEKARARVVWKNWCDGLPADVSTVWVYFGTAALDASPEPFISPPACDNKAAESTLQGFPYQEDTPGG
jgi:hypothetical protein